MSDAGELLERIDPPYRWQHYFTGLGSAAGRRGTVVFHQRRFSALREEGSALFVQHWAEASADRSVPLVVDWDRFIALEDAGFEVCITARWGDQLIGYAVYLLHPHLHYAGLTVGESDVFFLREEDRTGWVGVKLFQVAERLLAKRGVHEVWQREKIHVRPGRGQHGVGSVFRYLGYRPVEITWRKRIG